MRCTENMIILEVLRLREQLSYSLREIEKTSICSKTTAGKILKRCKELGLDYRQAAALSHDALQEAVFPKPLGRPSKNAPDYHAVHEKILSTKKNLQYQWEALVAAGDITLSYSRFCELYRKWKEDQGFGVHTPFERKPGEKLFIDWAGASLNCILDQSTGELIRAYFFITTLGDSSYPYCEAFPSMDQFSWNHGHVNALKWYNAIPSIFVPDNTRTAVTRADMWDPKLNVAYLSLAQHYRVAIEPARVRKPKDKGSVECGVRWLETWLLEYLKEQGHFFSFGELNQVIRERMQILSKRPYTEKDRKHECRLSLYQKRDFPQMRGLPAHPFEVFDVKRGTVGNNYHVEYKNFYYSVPYRLFKKGYELHAYQSTISIFIGGNQVALHQRRYSGGRYVTNKDHMPEKDRFYLQFGEKDGSHYRQQARTYGEATESVIASILNTYDYEPQSYKACMGVLSFAKRYGKEVVERACARALLLGRPTYSGVSRILKNNSQDIQLPKSIKEHTPQPDDLRTDQWRNITSQVGGES